MTDATPAQTILRERAVALAQTPPPTQAGAMLELLEFRLASERYALESRYVENVHPLRDLTALPCAPAFILGLVNIRGRVLPVINLKKFFALPEHGLTDLHRIILVRGHDLELGLLADVIVGMRTVAPASLQPALPTLTGIRADYLRGIGEGRGSGEGPLVVLDLQRILTDPRIIVNEEVTS